MIDMDDGDEVDQTTIKDIKLINYGDFVDVTNNDDYDQEDKKI